VKYGLKRFNIAFPVAFEANDGILKRPFFERCFKRGLQTQEQTIHECDIETTGG
jgi:hypothetical protein